MKAATITFLLLVFVCGIVCDPAPNDGKQQSVAAEANPGTTANHDEQHTELLSRDSSHNDDYYRHDGGYNHDGVNRRDAYGRDDGSYKHDGGYWHHDNTQDLFPEDPVRAPTCLCSRNLDLNTLSNDNRCTGICNVGGGYCSTTTSPTLQSICECADPAIWGAGTAFGFCGGKYSSGGSGAGLCLQATCPSDGTINLRGQAVPLTPAGNGCGCGATEFLYIYKGSAFTQVAADILVSNQQNADVTVSCKRGESFFICENHGVMITSSVKATFTAQTTGSCTALGTGTWSALGCKP